MSDIRERLRQVIAEAYLSSIPECTCDGDHSMPIFKNAFVLVQGVVIDEDGDPITVNAALNVDASPTEILGMLHFQQIAEEVDIRRQLSEDHE